SSRAFAARLPCIFQLPATSLARIPSGRVEKGEILPPDRREGQPKTLENSEPCRCSRLRTLSALRAQPERHRAVVHQSDLHVLAEATARYVGIARARTPDEMIEELASRIGRERGGEARAHALGGIRRKSELRHEQEAAAYLLDRKIHFTGAVGEHAIAQQTLEHALGDRFIVSRLRAYERQDSAIDGAQRLCPERDFGSRDALQQRDHPAKLGCLLHGFGDHSG